MVSSLLESQRARDGKSAAPIAPIRRGRTTTAAINAAGQRRTTSSDINTPSKGAVGYRHPMPVSTNRPVRGLTDGRRTDPYPRPSQGIGGGPLAGGGGPARTAELVTMPTEPSMTWRNGDPSPSAKASLIALAQLSGSIPPEPLPTSS